MDVGKLIREQVPDRSGKILPADLTSGSFEFRDLTDPFIGTLFEGKVTSDTTYTHVAYGHTQCCALDQPFLTFNPLSLAVGSGASGPFDTSRQRHRPRKSCDH